MIHRTSLLALSEEIAQDILQALLQGQFAGDVCHADDIGKVPGVETFSRRTTSSELLGRRRHHKPKPLAKCVQKIVRDRLVLWLLGPWIQTEPEEQYVHILP